MTDYVITLTVAIWFLWAVSMYGLWMSSRTTRILHTYLWYAVTVISFLYSFIPSLILISLLSH